MTVWLAVSAAGALLLAAMAVSARRRARAREARRVEELARLAARLETALGALPSPPQPVPESPSAPPAGQAPLVAGRLPGRAALLEAVAGDIASAHANDARLTAVIVRAAEERRPGEVVDAVRQVTRRPAYAVGPRSAAFTLPGDGRANGLGALARIASMTGATGRAVEWETDESPVELVARLLEQSEA